MAEQRLIDANKLKNSYGRWANKNTEFLKPEVDHYIDTTPTVDAKPVVHGEWEADPCGWHCNQCGADGRDSWRFCPNCGSMNGGEKA